MNEKAFDIILEMASDIQSINLHLQENVAMLMMPNHD